MLLPAFLSQWSSSKLKITWQSASLCTRYLTVPYISVHFILKEGVRQRSNQGAKGVSQRDAAISKLHCGDVLLSIFAESPTLDNYTANLNCGSISSFRVTLGLLELPIDQILFAWWPILNIVMSEWHKASPKYLCNITPFICPHSCFLPLCNLEFTDLLIRVYTQSEITQFPQTLLTLDTSKPLTRVTACTDLQSSGDSGAKYLFFISFIVHCFSQRTCKYSAILSNLRWWACDAQTKCRVQC